MGFAPRRSKYRIPLQIFLNEYIRDHPYRCMSMNLSPGGIYLNRLSRPLELGLYHGQEQPVVGLEFELPGTSEVIWAKGEVRYDATEELFYGTGVQFTGITRFHQRLIEDFVAERRARRLRQILATIRRNRLN